MSDPHQDAISSPVTAADGADAALIEKIDALLPQTQCRRCGYDGCRPYARALAHGEADINQCPPGGSAGIHRLAALLGRAFIPLSPVHGTEQSPRVARIDENVCIGCTLCIQACPVDAIIGASKQMHTVLDALCTGCELCIEPCPVDCIVMVAAPQSQGAPSADYAMSPAEQATADAARGRYEFRNFRLEREKRERAERLAAKAPAAATAASAGPSDDLKKALIAAALERARAQRAAVQPRNTDQLTPEQQAQIAETDARRAGKSE